jgi:hypothetical protein
MVPPRTPSLTLDALLAVWRSPAKPGSAERVARTPGNTSPLREFP